MHILLVFATPFQPGEADYLPFHVATGESQQEVRFTRCCDRCVRLRVTYLRVHMRFRQSNTCGTDELFFVITNQLLHRCRRERDTQDVHYC